MSDTDQSPFPSHLSAAETTLYRVFTRPRAVAVVCVTALAVLGWAYLGLMVGGLLRTGNAGALGPGIAWLERLVPADAGGVGQALLTVLCRPVTSAPGAFTLNAADFALVFAMWCAMTLAMMLPTASGTIATYAELAETAGEKGERVVSPLLLTAGFAAAWLGFAFAAAVLQTALMRAGWLNNAGATSALLAGAIFIGAGAYQFSALKHACLTACQRPFPFFFANWTSERAGVFRLGLRQGAYCVGCCWATMLLMFAVGVMNIVWMAALGLVVAIEKTVPARKFTYAAGLFLLAAGLWLVATSIMTQWPAAAT